MMKAIFGFLQGERVEFVCGNAYFAILNIREVWVIVVVEGETVLGMRVYVI